MNEPQSEKIGRLMRELAKELEGAFPNAGSCAMVMTPGLFSLSVTQNKSILFLSGPSHDPSALVGAAVDAVAKAETAKLTSNVKSSKAEVFSPAEYLRDELEARGWTDEDLAEISGLSVSMVDELVDGTRPINWPIAEKLGAAFGTSAEVWMNLQRAADKSA